MKPKIAIILGDKQEFSAIIRVTDILDRFKIPYSVNICSAYQSPNELQEYINKINSCDACKVVIAASSMSEALPGIIASKTNKPVIGLPLSAHPIISSNSINSMAAMLSMLQMPVGTPVLTVGIDNPKNAALAAARIVALSNAEVACHLEAYRISRRAFTNSDNSNLREKKHEPFDTAALKYKCEF